MFLITYLTLILWSFKFICHILFYNIFVLLYFYFLAIIRDVVQKRFEVYHKLEEAARLALEQEAAAKAAEERKKAEEMVAKAAEEAKAEETEKSEQEGGAEGDGRETADKPEDDSVAGEEGGSEQAPTTDTRAESGQNEPTEDAEPEQE